MADALLLALGIVLILCGLAGCILPVLPGPPLSFLGLFVLRFTGFVNPVRTGSFDALLWAVGAAALVVTLLDNLVPLWGARTFGASRYGMIGAATGLVIGLFFAPVGLIAGPFLGAVAGETLAGKKAGASFYAGLGSVLGFAGGVLLKLVVSVIITGFFIRQLFSG